MISVSKKNKKERRISSKCNKSKKGRLIHAP
uniref:Uncharacterized protein n=2 Tax=unclassified Caudoviricetes TaxID=2788787 RepID=A0A8S5M9J3_9CAUD|nr:MAG TPA: hypothetical protein [Siphoviridae sp. ctPi453]DAD78751.1 MAG TPA: hypothetical protein [Siphoviridae sp. ctH2C26]